ncbi:MAG: type II toxin-antitoxin system HicA family toxin [Bacteroidota bacterium]|nr:type II toxin-antitoxin system HicA family toxin [Bacteroidota bacterium]
MPKLQRLTAVEAETMLFKNGFKLIRTKGSHRIYQYKNKRIVLPFHTGKILHPKIVKQVITAIEKVK